ncbi:sensor histidine kinase [Pyxidicoccus xibeiensis]|uniref:sensor histidine kinase n=1 Tax=Pyxidicoccus xibeiensis TaxID=2906759 RepID=UPI0020A7A767|nr:ATP-binding protein [Pyxidicoccus xibeiensis]MCP3141345.1 ATP-binding protein [Pyxidicoccus xibeiensis]
MTPYRPGVWLIDDSSLDARRTHALLAADYAVEVFHDVGPLLERVSQNALLPHVLLLDWHLPGISGREALAFLRERFDEVSLPILVLTASTEREDLEAALLAGANDFVPKPYNDVELLARVRTLVRVRTQADSLREREGALRLREAEARRALADARAARALAEGALSDVQEATEALQDSRARLQLVLDTIPSLINFVDTEGRYVINNQAYAAWFGVPVGDLRGRPVHEVFGAENSRQLGPMLERARAGEVVEYEVPFIFGGGRSGYIHGTHVPYHGPDGTLRGYVSLVQDVTERKRSEAALRASHQFEQQLIGIVSHDLRTPLAAINLTATLLKRQVTGEREQRGLSRICLSAERATRMIGDLLDFTRARHGSGLPIQRQLTHLHELAQTVVEEAQAMQPGARIEVVRAGDGDGEWDPDRLAQVVANLVGNALQYGPQDLPVRVTTQAEGDTATLEVHNHGRPISPDLLPRIFEPLERGSELVSQTGRSIGLGLFIVRHIVQAHGGTVDVRSTGAEGTTFTVRLPRRLPGPPERRP